MVLNFCSSKEFLKRLQPVQKAGEFVESGHYYSAIPSQSDQLRAIKWRAISGFELPGIRFHWEQQWTLMEDLKQHLHPGKIPIDPSGIRRYGFNNPSFGYGDALFLQAVMRHFRPRQIIEVGSGHTSALMLDINEFDLNSTVSFEFVEPYPELFFSLTKKNDRHWPIHTTIMQEADLNIFRKLGKNDILFIDSTHVLKAGSDVFHLLFHVLPILAPGVLIHIHDIFWPFEYGSDWLQEGRAWTEAYALRAFLQYNKEFSIKLFPNALVVQNPDWFKENAPEVLKNAGGSLWITRNERSLTQNPHFLKTF
jgi:hypothetical protein